MQIIFNRTYFLLFLMVQAMEIVIALYIRGDQYFFVTDLFPEITALF